MPYRILFVCLGNICRSPSAEGMFRMLAPEIETDSAGTAGYHVGAPPYGPMQKAALRRGIDLSGLRSRQFRREDFDGFDLILAMDRENRADIEALRPVGNTTEVHLFSKYAPEGTMPDVPDPYYTRDFDGCLDLIARAAQGLKDALEKA